MPDLVLFWDKELVEQLIYYRYNALMLLNIHLHYALYGPTYDISHTKPYYILGPVTPSPILLYSWPDDLYTMQTRNPILQPNRSAQFVQQAQSDLAATLDN